MRLLVVEDDPSLRELLRTALPDVDVATAGTLAEARALLQPPPDVVLTDVHLGAGDSGVRFAAELRDAHPRLPVIVMTAFGDLSLAIEAIRAGAYDFLTKPLDLAVLRTAVARAGEAHALRREVRDLRREVRLARGLHELIGESPAMRALFELIGRVAPAPSSVLIRGESGTGKELVARALHAGSARARGPFVALNCAAVPEALLESELFGHRKGAFTDASAARAGLLVQADGGTLLLDEVGDLPLAMQAKLLRVLQERRVRPVGADRDLPIDVRVLAATHQDLERAVAEGRFREDLFYRLDVITLELPPLRERGRDALLLAQRFVEHYAAGLGKRVIGIAPEAARQLLTYSWPGNVRELQNAIERAIVLCRYDEIQLDDLPRRVATARERPDGPPLADRAAELLPLAEVERRHIQRVLDAVGGRRAEAAQLLGIDRKTLYRKLARWDAETAR